MNTSQQNWTVLFTGKARKQQKKLPADMQTALNLLRRELQIQGPVQAKWPHFSKLKGKKDVYHCHLNKGKPRYVVVWQVVDKQIKFMEICYVGTHENADYKRRG